MTNPILHNNIVYKLSRCPQCGVATPLIEKVSQASLHLERSHSYGDDRWYFTGRCSRCRNHILFYGSTHSKRDFETKEPPELNIIRSFPSLEIAAEELPQMALKFFQQALESKHAPDGALMLTASAIDAILKDKGYLKGTLFQRIKAASDDGLLTSEMTSWAHEIRLSANEPRHADDRFEGATPEDAEQIIAFAKALGEYLYVLPAKVQKWQTKALEAEAP